MHAPASDTPLSRSPVISDRTPLLSVVVPLFNCLALTQAMLASLQATLPAGISYEVLLVDDGSTDGTREWLATLSPPIRVILNERNLGYAAANNRGAALARGENLLLLNNDLILRRGWLEPMLAALRLLGDRAGLIGNIQHAVATGAIDHSGILIDAKGKPTHDRALPLRRWLPGRLSARTVPAATGACLLVNRTLYLAAGGFDERYVNGCEDVDLALRLEAMGKRNVVALRSRIDHHVSASPGRKRRDEVNTHLLFQRWQPALVRHGARAWTWHYLKHEWTSPRDPAAYPAAARLLAYALHLRRTPPREAIDGITAAIKTEMKRWEEMFGRDVEPASRRSDDPRDAGPT